MVVLGHHDAVGVEVILEFPQVLVGLAVGNQLGHCLLGQICNFGAEHFEALQEVVSDCAAGFSRCLS